MGKTAVFNRRALREYTVAQRFASTFETEMQKHVGDSEVDTEMLSKSITESLRHAESTCLPEAPCTGKKPWISDRTMDLIQRRRKARSQAAFEVEMQLNKEVKLSARKDKRNWLSELAGSGKWAKLRQLTKGVTHSEG